MIADALIVVPKFDDLVFSSRDEVLSFGGDGKSVDLTGLGAIEHSDGLSVEAIPVGDLPVGSSGQELGLIGVVEDLLKHGRLEEALDSSVVDDVPDDGGTVVGGRDGLVVLLVDLNVGNAASVFLEGSLHDLRLGSDPPDSDFSFHASGDDSLTVVGGHDGGDTVVVGVVDGVQEFARLGEEGADLTVVPSGNNALSVGHELDGVALKSGNLNSEKLLTSRGVPHADVVH